jgi:hypothetical protein
MPASLERWSNESEFVFFRLRPSYLVIANLETIGNMYRSLFSIGEMQSSLWILLE